MLSEIEKWEVINRTTTFEELKDAILLIADEDGYIRGRQSLFDKDNMRNRVDLVLNGEPFNLLTRSYGIRQQFIYLNTILWLRNQINRK